MTRPLRSARWFGGHDLAGFIHRATLHAEGISRTALAGRPVIGICNSWSELVNCNLHFRGLAESVKRGVLLAGGVPLEFPTISLGENLMKPTSMLFRNLMAMDVEESIRAYPLDAVVLLGGCDKTVPAQLMGAASADVPAIMVTGGPAEPAVFRGRQLGAGTDLWHYADELRAGRMTRSEFDELEAAATPTVGHCNEMGTASSMTSVVEALGMCLSGTASIPAVDAARHRAAEATGRRAVELAVDGPRPSEVLTPAAFDNAITLLMALGGATNVVLHLLALAGRVGVPLSLVRFDELSRRTPVIANVRPSGEHLVEQLHHAGGVAALLKELAPLLDLTAPTVEGQALGELVERASVHDRDVILPLESPLAAEGGIAVLRGSLAPDGAIVKQSAATPALMRHRGPALVFEDVYDVQARIDEPALPVTPETVLVLRNSGPRGGPGMPEWGAIPVPKKLLRAGVTDVVRVSDARMSGTASGTVVLHVAPEAYAGGPLRAVRDGDPILLDVAARRLDLDVPEPEVRRRLEEVGPPTPRYARGWGALYADHVLQADTGCDLDFLRARPGEPAETEPYGLLSGWVGGW
ncbi:MAG TPA: IlvD/Edd family dehydratase [Gaiella sp.]|uniref:IlvD/Edd family dehydratase n=1 Tax=Gaiella sp. TaxID=2663207 RepID=UPI002D7E3DC7|nr:IlvD/Edd family dehydratase [Gaiella sp.]HET9289276.1 IlvD/Edd family dehydratase [Gaiella sp.]